MAIVARNMVRVVDPPVPPQVILEAELVAVFLGGSNSLTAYKMTADAKYGAVIGSVTLPSGVVFPALGSLGETGIVRQVASVVPRQPMVVMLVTTPSLEYLIWNLATGASGIYSPPATATQTIHSTTAIPGEVVFASAASGSLVLERVNAAGDVATVTLDVATITGSPNLRAITKTEVWQENGSDPAESWNLLTGIKSTPGWTVSGSSTTVPLSTISLDDTGLFVDPLTYDGVASDVRRHYLSGSTLHLEDVVSSGGATPLTTEASGIRLARDGVTLTQFHNNGRLKYFNASNLSHGSWASSGPNKSIPDRSGATPAFVFALDHEEF